jgi:hypothetical protein
MAGSKLSRADALLAALAAIRALPREADLIKASCWEYNAGGWGWEVSHRRTEGTLPPTVFDRRGDVEQRLVEAALSDSVGTRVEASSS